MLMVARARVVVASMALAALVTAVTAAGLDEAAPFRVEPDRVAVGSFFRGASLRVSGPVEAGSDVIVVITASRTVEETYNRKGRVGPFWATVGKVTIGEVPALHLIASGTPVSGLLSRDEIDARLLDLDALVLRAAIRPAVLDRRAVAAEYLKLKQRQGVVGLFEGAVQLHEASGGSSFDATIPWPASAPAGTYRVVVRHVRSLRVVREETRPLEVAYVGLPRLIAHLAFERSLAYGVLAVTIALGVGFVMGLLFKRGTAGH
jgi:uncharacterized protein (TIGR02186 family)